MQHNQYHLTSQQLIDDLIKRTGIDAARVEKFNFVVRWINKSVDPKSFQRDVNNEIDFSFEEAVKNYVKVSQLSRDTHAYAHIVVFASMK